LCPGGEGDTFALARLEISSGLVIAVSQSSSSSSGRTTVPPLSVPLSLAAHCPMYVIGWTSFVNGGLFPKEKVNY
jgi:hypothetical protein